MLDDVERVELLGDRGEKNLSPWVQRLDAKRTAAPGEGERRVDEPDVPARVAPWIFVARCQEHPPMSVEPVDEGVDRIRDRDLFDGSSDPDSSPGLVGRGADHVASSV